MARMLGNFRFWRMCKIFLHKMTILQCFCTTMPQVCRTEKRRLCGLWLLLIIFLDCLQNARHRYQALPGTSFKSSNTSWHQHRLLTDTYSLKSTKIVILIADNSSYLLSQTFCGEDSWKLSLCLLVSLPFNALKPCYEQYAAPAFFMCYHI